MGYPLHQCIILQAHETPAKPAIISPGREPLSYAALAQQIEYTVATLNAWGIGRGDRVALALPNGPDFAAAYAGASACTTAVPCDPAASAADYTKTMTELGIKALITDVQLDTPATAARELGISVIHLHSETIAGQFKLEGGQAAKCDSTGYAHIDDLALILRTSGSTGLAKAVAQTHKNICAKTRDIAQGPELNAEDSYLCIMPLFHGHGLSMGIMTPLALGMSAIYLPVFDVELFCRCLRELHPTYYSASFTHQQTILAWLKERPEAIAGHSLRFIQSGSGPLMPVVQKQLEQIFKVPVLQYAGSTEVGIIAGNPLPPRQNKAGTVGIPWGNEVAIMDENAKRLHSGEIGEVWIRGDAVVGGYYNNPEATKAAFVDGWFRSGDLGFFDNDGYLTLCGRIKDIINRGGQKVSCYEIDAALLEHPAVAGACAFPVSHRTLGEEVAAAVVHRPGEKTDAAALQAFLSSRLTAYKIPTRWVFADHIPKTVNGKIQRGRLAQHFRLGADETPDIVAPENEIERKIAAIWASVMSLERIGRDNDFIALGGNSLLAAQIAARIQETFKVDLALGELLDASTVSALAKRIAQSAADVCEPSYKSLVALSPQGANTKPPIYFIHGRAGTVWDYLRLAPLLDQNQPAYGIQNLNQDRNTILSTTAEEIVAEYVSEIRRLQPDGPYYLCGWSLAGLFAFELARQLLAQKQKIGLLAIIDTLPRNIEKATGPGTIALYLARRLSYHARVAFSAGKLNDPAFYSGRLQALKTHLGFRPGSTVKPGAPAASDSEEDPYKILGDRYIPQPIDTPITFFLTTAISKVAAWKHLAKKGIAIHQLPTTHDGMFKSDYVNRFSVLFNKILSEAQKKQSI